MGDSTQTTMQSNSSAPWGPAQPYLKSGLKDADALYQSGGAAPVNTMSTTVPFSGQTQTALDATQANAQANMGGQGLSGQAQSILGAGGYNPAQQQSMDYLSNVGSNPFDLSKNQAYQTYRQNLADDVTNSVNMNAAAAGRYGSGMHTQNLVNDLTGALSAADLNQMGRMDQLNAQRFGMGQQGMSNLSTAYDLQNLPIQDMQSVGGAYEDLYGRQLNDQLRIAQEQMTAPQRGIEWRQAIAGGAGSLGGTSTSTAQMPGQNPALTGLGYGLTGLGLLGGL